MTAASLGEQNPAYRSSPPSPARAGGGLLLPPLDRSDGRGPSASHAGWSAHREAGAPLRAARPEARHDPRPRKTRRRERASQPSGHATVERRDGPIAASHRSARRQDVNPGNPAATRRRQRYGAARRRCVPGDGGGYGSGPIRCAARGAEVDGRVARCRHEPGDRHGGAPIDDARPPRSLGSTACRASSDTTTTPARRARRRASEGRASRSTR